MGKNLLFFKINVKTGIFFKFRGDDYVVEISLKLENCFERLREDFTFFEIA